MRLRFGVTVGLFGSALAGVIAIACGIEEGGVVDAVDGSSNLDVLQPVDAIGSKDVSAVDTYLPPSCGDAAGCLPPVPAGWQILTVLPDPDASCPQNFNQADLQTDPQLDLGACACACADMSDAGCGGPVTLTNSPNGLCWGGGSTQTALAAGCTVTGGANPNQYLAYDAGAPSIACGQPTPTGSKNGSSTTLRVCQPTCGGDFCGSIVNGTKACIFTNGDVPCVASFGVKTLVGSAVDYQCLACPACTPKAASCTVAVTLYDNSDCTKKSVSFTVKPACIKWLASDQWKSAAVAITPPSGPFCSYATVDPGGDAGFVGPRTVCCTK